MEAMEKILKNLAKVAIAAALVISPNSRIWAQDTNDLLNMSLEELMNTEVVTASKKAQKISDAPATVISYSADQIKKYGWRDLKDIFRSMPGVDVSYENQGEVRSLVLMRGITGNQKIAILQDGEKYNPTTGERFLFGHNTPLSFYKRVEVVYGPASALYGADAYSGVINLITKDGKDINGAQAGVTYSSTNAVIADVLFGKAVGDDMDFTLALRAYQGEDYKIHEDYDDYAVVNQYKDKSIKKEYPINNWNILSKVKYKDFTFGFDWQHTLESGAMATIPNNYVYSDQNLWGQDLRHIYLTYKKPINDDFALTATVSGGDYEINPASNFLLFQDTDLNKTSPSFKYGYSRYYKGLLQADWNITESIHIISGLSFEDVLSFPKTKNLDNGPFRTNGDYTDDMTSLPYNLVDPKTGRVFGLVGLTDSKFGERNYSNTGFFVQGDIGLMENLTLTLGTRYDYNSIYKETINPRAGLVYKPTKSLSIKALFGTAYIQPSNYYRWENFANPFIMHVPNQDIKPEKITNISLSTTYYVNDNLSLRLDLYRNNMTDVIGTKIVGKEFNDGQDYYNPYRQVMGESPYVDWVEINANLGKIYTQGFEIEANYKLQNLIINLSYSFLDGKDEDEDHPIAKVSPHKINLNADYTIGDFCISTSLRYYSKVQALKSNSMYGTAGDKSYEFDGAFIAYANLNYAITNSLSANLAVDNIFNTKHYGAAPYGESGWVQYRAPQALRKIFLGLKINV